MRASRVVPTVLLIALFVLPCAKYSHAQTTTTAELQAQLEQKQQQKAVLDAENVKLQQQIDTVNKQAQTLQTAVKVLDTTQKKLVNDIKVTQNQISTAELSIEQLGIEMTDTQNQMQSNELALAETIRNLAEADNTSIVETLLKYDNINELWSNIETLQSFQASVRHSTDALKKLQSDLADEKVQNEQKKGELVGYKGTLVSQNSVVQSTKNTKTTLLAQTKNQEDAYRKQLAQNIELGKQFEQEEYQFESKLNVGIDQSKFPSEGSPVLSWPLDSIFVTQKFGFTVDSKRLYVSGSHNGVDFRATVGTPVKAALSGIVLGMGNTDEEKGCYSYGRWILIEHPNGISTIYAHLSVSQVTVGQAVTTGEVIGLSGGMPGMDGAGYSIGPHLHLGLFASQGVHIEQFTSSMYCKQVFVPIAATDAYLDPLAYLPPLN